VATHVETRRWQDVILSSIEVYRCAAGHDHLVIPCVTQLLELMQTSKKRAFTYDEERNTWSTYAEARPLGDKLYVLEERELPDGEWTCDDLLGFDTAEEAVEAVEEQEGALDHLTSRDGLRDGLPDTEVRIVLYARHSVVKVLTPAARGPGNN
jgi:hypothetical protein